MQQATELPMYENLHSTAEEKAEQKFLPEPGIPVEPKNRKMEDKFFLYIFIFCSTIATISLLLYLSFVHPNWENEENSPQYDRNRHRVRSNFLLILFGVSDDVPRYGPMLGAYSVRISIATSISLGVTLILAVLFRFATTVAIWFILVLAWVFPMEFIIFLWFTEVGTITCIILTVLMVLLLVPLGFAEKKISLVIMLFREAAITLFSIKKMILVPILGLITQLVIITGFTTTILYIVTTLDKNYFSLVMCCAVIVSIAAFWTMGIVIGVQYMTVSGAITKWYFSRNKINGQDNILYVSFCTTLRYHLGTIALASIVLALLSIPRILFMIFKWIVLSLKLRILFSWLINPLSSFFKFFSKHSYTVTAMYGTSFIQSGRKSKELLSLNACNINFAPYTGDFIIVLSQIFMATFPALALFFSVIDIFFVQFFLCYTIVVGSSFICSYAILSTYEAAFSTLFLCINQDFLMNDGLERPYAMNDNIKELLKSSATLFQTEIENRHLPQMYSV